MAYTRERLGELLVKSGLIDDEQLQQALEVQNRTGGKVGSILVEQLIVTDEGLARTLAEQKGLEFVSLPSQAFDRDAVATMPQRVARRRLVVPVRFEEGELVLAMADPLDVEAIDEAELRSNAKVRPVVATTGEILHAIEKYMAAHDAFQEVMDATAALEAGSDDDGVDEKVAAGGDVPVVRLVNQLIREATATSGCGTASTVSFTRSCAFRRRSAPPLHHV
jgi:type IV pilus assembly protein PilB